MQNFKEWLEEKSLYEMSYFNSHRTGLPSSLVVFVRTETKKLPHSNYRIKIEKNKVYAGSFLVNSKDQKMVEEGQVKLTSSEKRLVQSFISNNVSALINHIDGKIDSGDLAIEFAKNKG